MRGLANVKVSRLDRLILGIAPRYGVRRLRAKTIGQIISPSGGGYDAGKSVSKELQEWHPDIDSAISALHPGLWELRARSRDSIRNSALAAGAMDVACKSVIGSGMKVQPSVDYEALEIDEGAAEEWGQEARRVFDAWASPEGGCDIGLNYSFEELQGLVFRGVFEGGDVLVLDRWLPRRPCEFGTCVQLIEAERVSNPDLDCDTEKLAGGVEVDLRTGRTLAYHVTRSHPGHYDFGYDWLRLPAFSRQGERVARLVYRPHRIGERRGVPWLATVLKSLKQMDRHTNAELQAAVISSFFTAFIYNEHPDADPLQDGLQDGGPDTAEGRYYAEDTDIRLGPGLLARLGPGERIQFAQPERPNDQYKPFVETMWQHIGIGLGIPYEILTMRFGDSYSASKGALAEAWKTFRTTRQWMVRHFCQPVWERVLAEAVASGRLDAPGFFEDDRSRRAWCRASWMGDSQAAIDPEKEIKAARERIAAGVSTIDRESRELTGTTFAENVVQRKKEAEMMAEVTAFEMPMMEEGDENGDGRGGSGDNDEADESDDSDE